MRTFAIAFVLLVVALLGYCSLPLRSVAILTVSLADQGGRPIKSGAKATFLDAKGAEITSIASGSPGSWDNKLHWWAHTHHDTSRMRPVDAKRATAVRLDAAGCESTTVPVVLDRTYEPLSFAPHGGGAAYFIYRFERDVALACR
jgi:hypothetical protein